MLPTAWGAILHYPSSDAKGTKNISCDFRKKYQLQYCLNLIYSNAIEDLVFDLTKNGFIEETKIGDTFRYFRKNYGGIGNNIIAVILYDEPFPYQYKIIVR